MPRCHDKGLQQSPSAGDKPRFDKPLLHDMQNNNRKDLVIIVEVSILPEDRSVRVQRSSATFQACNPIEALKLQCLRDNLCDIAQHTRDKPRT